MENNRSGLGNTVLHTLKLWLLWNIVCAVLFISVAVFCFFTTGWFASDTFNLAIIPFAVIVIYGFSAFLEGYFQRKSAVEAEDRALLEKRKERSSAFDSDEDILFTAERTLKNYRKYSPYVIAFISFSTIVTSLVFYWLAWSSKIEPAVAEKPTQAAFIAFVLSLIVLFSGVFCIGQSRVQGFRWFRPVGVWLVLFAFLMLAVVTAVLFEKSGVPQWDYYLSRIFFAIFAILAFELLINFVIEFYRPRTGTETRPVFESRLLALLSEPGGVLRNIADTLDYQFGFQVSGTWVYGFFEKSIIPFLFIWMALFWGFTAIDEIAPGEMGVREFFGIHADNALPPGVYLKWPWPIEKIRKIPVNRTQEIFIGPELKDQSGKMKRPDVILWTKPHYAKEGRFLIATELKNRSEESSDVVQSINDKDAPVSMVAAMLPIQFKIKQSGVFDYAYGHKYPVKMLKALAEKQVTSYFANADMLKLMSNEREKAIRVIKNRIQKASDDIKLGVQIIAVAFLDAHPPIDENKLPEAFQEVVGAQEEKEAAIWDANAYRARTIPQAEAKALQLILQAQAYKTEKTRVSEAEIKRFRKQLIGYRAMPEMYILNMKLDFLENDCHDVRKYIVPGLSQYDVYVINLEEKQRLDLLDITDLQENNNNNKGK